MPAALTKCARSRLVRKPTDKEYRRPLKVVGGHASALRESHLEEIANALCGGRKDSARFFIQDVRKLRDLADFVTDQDLAAVIKWIAPLLDEPRGKVPRAAPSQKYTCVLRLLFPGLQNRPDQYTQRWIEHIRMLRQLAATSYGGDMLAALAWVETPASAHDVSQLSRPNKVIMADSSRRSTHRTSHSVLRSTGMKRTPSAQSVYMRVKCSRPTMVTATATTATVRGKPSHPQHTLSRIPRWAGL
jgi:hypothetical protein